QTAGDCPAAPDPRPATLQTIEAIGVRNGRLSPREQQFPVGRKHGWEIALAAAPSVLALVQISDPLLIAGQLVELLALRQVDQPQHLVLAIANSGHARTGIERREHLAFPF